MSLVAIFGCAMIPYEGRSSGPITQVSQISLNENNFKVLKTHLTGHARCRYILGLIPIDNPDTMSTAVREIGKSAWDLARNRPTQLINWTKDGATVNYFLFADHEITLTADLIEYTK